MANTYIDDPNYDEVITFMQRAGIETRSGRVFSVTNDRYAFIAHGDTNYKTYKEVCRINGIWCLAA